MGTLKILRFHAPNVHDMSEMADLYHLKKNGLYKMANKQPERFVNYCIGAKAIKQKQEKLNMIDK